MLEQGCIGGGTTAAGMGHVVVMDDSPAQLALTRYSRDLWRELAAEVDAAGLAVMPKDVEYDPCGTLWVAADEEEMVEVRRKKALCDEHGVGAEIWDAQTLAAREPHLRKGLAGALRLPDDGVIYPPCAARFLADRAVKRGAELRLKVAVQKLEPGAVVLADGTRISCGIAVNAAGAASPKLTPGLQVKKRKGHLVITDRYPGYVKHQIVELGYLKSAHSVSSDSVAFNIQPRKTGQMLIGSSRQYNAEGTEVDAGILAKMLRRAAEYLPDVGTLKAIRVWTGHRPATPDKLPVIGPSIESERIYLATGHEGLGITTSTGTGRLLADLILKRPTAIPAEPYLPSRYAKSPVAAEVAHA
jgi:glycine/D-amino acid oxidase-like deaminating enzyme